MAIVVAIILGIVQGLTEFLPVSSSGHLFLLSKLFKVETSLYLTVILHVATLLAVLFVLHKEIWEIITHPFSKKAINLYVATIPTVAIVLLFKTKLDSIFESGAYLPFFFMLTAVLLFGSYVFSKNKKQPDFAQEIKHSTAFFMGLAQGLACVPGISRSGSTICTGLLCGEDKKECAKFSFLMSVPIIFASLIYELLFSSESVVSIGTISVAAAFLSAFLVGILSIKFMLKIMEKTKYYYFSIYLFVLSILSLIFLKV